MSDVEEKEVQLRLSAKDSASSIIARCAGMAGNLANRFDGITEAVHRWGSMMVGFSGVYTLTQAARGAAEYVDQIDRVRQLTGLSAKNITGMAYAMELNEIEGSDIETTLTKIGKKSYDALTKNKALAASAKKWGVDLKNGPEKTMISIADAVEKGRIKATQVSKLTGLSGTALSNAMGMFNSGGKALNETFEEGRRLNGGITDDALDSFAAYDEATKKFKQAWRGAVASVVVQFLPAMEKLQVKLREVADRYGPKIKNWAQYLVEHLPEIVKAAKMFAGYMAASSLTQKFTGNGLLTSLVGNKDFKGLMSRGADYLKKYAPKVGGTWQAAGGASGFSYLPGGIKMLKMGVGRMAAAAVIVAVVANAVRMLANNTYGFRDKFAALFKSIGASLLKLWSTIQPLITIIGKLGGMLLNIASAALLESLREAVWWFDKLLIVFNWMADKIKWIINLLPTGAIDIEAIKRRGSPAYASQQDRLAGAAMGQNVVDMLAARYADSLRARTKKGDGQQNPDAPYMDFRNSRFDITQKFSDGFDPDRIAVAFANDIAKLGENKLQSGFSPLFAVR